MKTIAIITIHVGQNFGSNLQTIATSEIIKGLGYHPLIVNYIPRRVARKYYWLDAFKNPLKLCWRVINAPLFYRNLHIYEKYQEKYCDLTEPIYDEDDFARSCPKADIFMTGSDQVWNSNHNQGFNNRYFWDGLSKESRKIAYASSFGTDNLPDDEYEMVKRYLEGYRSISVRELSAKTIVESMGLKAEHLLDPTFMLDKSEWVRFMSPRIVNEPYLLVYVPYNIVDKGALYKTARTIASNQGLKVVTFSWNYRNDNYADRTIKFANPGDFLSLMYYADYVITNSFHGTAFSINLNKQFSVYMPSGFGTRITSILSLCKLEDRLIKNQEDVEHNCNMIDYSETNDILVKERYKALGFLKKALA